MFSCSVCKGLDESVCIHGEGPGARGVCITSGQSLEIIHNAAKKGCPTCTLLADAISKMKPSAIHDQDIKVGWDINRLDGVRVVAHRAISQGPTGEVVDVLRSRFLFSIDIFARPGDRAFGKSDKRREIATDIWRH